MYVCGLCVYQLINLKYISNENFFFFSKKNCNETKKTNIISAIQQKFDQFLAIFIGGLISQQFTVHAKERLSTKLQIMRFHSHLNTTLLLFRPAFAQHLALYFPIQFMSFGSIRLSRSFSRGFYFFSLSLPRFLYTFQ